jgi:hypothetical protein
MRNTTFNRQDSHTLFGLLDDENESFIMTESAN